MLFLVTDGLPQTGDTATAIRDDADKAKAAGIKIVTVVFDSNASLVTYYQGVATSGFAYNLGNYKMMTDSVVYLATQTCIADGVG